MFYDKIDVYQGGATGAGAVKPTAQAFTLGSALPAGIIKSRKKFTSHDYTVVDPMNMRAVDDLLLRLVLGQRAEMGVEGTLFVVMGECHPMPTHKMAQAGLVENLPLLHQQHNNPSLKSVFMDEVPYNDLVSYLKDFYDHPIPEGQHDNLHQQDRLGHLFARAVMARNAHDYDPHSRNHLYTMLTDYQIPLTLMDAGKSSCQNYLNPNDPIAREVARQKFKIDLNKSFQEDIGLPRRMAIRNGVMAHRAAAGAVEHQAGIAILATGLGHLGHKRESFDYEHSLPVALAKTMRPKDRIMTVFCASAGYGYLPENITPKDQHPCITPVIIRGMAEDVYFFNSSECSETSFIGRLGKSYGSAIPSRFHPPTLPKPEDVLREVEALLAKCAP